MGESLDVTQSTPSVKVARLLWAIAKLHVDENKARVIEAQSARQATVAL